MHKQLLFELEEKNGYYLIDEIENHINRRIVEFILGLFTE